jgi:hypothetical protein
MEGVQCAPLLCVLVPLIVSVATYQYDRWNGFLFFSIVLLYFVFAQCGAPAAEDRRFELIGRKSDEEGSVGGPSVKLQA